MPPVVMRDYRATHALTLGGRTLSEGPCDLHMDDAYLPVKGDRTTRVECDQQAVVGNRGLTLSWRARPTPSR